MSDGIIVYGDVHSDLKRVRILLSQEKEENAALRQKLEVAREALEFYASEHFEPIDYINPPTTLRMDVHRVAREALAALKEEGEK